MQNKSTYNDENIDEVFCGFFNQQPGGEVLWNLFHADKTWNGNYSEGTAEQSSNKVENTQLSDGYVKQRGPLQGSIAFQSTMHWWKMELNKTVKQKIGSFYLMEDIGLLLKVS